MQEASADAHAYALQGGTFTYALGNLRVSKIDVPRHKVVVVCKRDGTMTVKATDISAHLNGPPLLACLLVLPPSPASATCWVPLAGFPLPPPRPRLTHSRARECVCAGFTWLYKQKGGPHLKDSGTGDASMQGICPP